MKRIKLKIVIRHTTFIPLDFYPDIKSVEDAIDLAKDDVDELLKLIACNVKDENIEITGEIVEE